MSGKQKALTAVTSAHSPAGTTSRTSHPQKPSAQDREKAQKPRMSQYGPFDDLIEHDAHDLELENEEVEIDLEEQLTRQKEFYPGACTWAEDEEKLFEILFCRQDLPILPAHWEVDLRGVPVGEANFTASDEQIALVYAHSKEFRGMLSPPRYDFVLLLTVNAATTALIRLIDLTPEVRTATQSGLRQRSAGMIKKGLDQFLSWAAEDGGYSHLRVVPNIVTEIIDQKMQETDITELVQSRMRALARLQREFFRVDRDPNFWDIAEADTVAAAVDDTDETTMERLLIQKYLSPHRKRSSSVQRRNTSMDDELATLPIADVKGTPIKEETPKRCRPFKNPSDELDELAQNSTSGLHNTPPSARTETKRLSPRTPPNRNSEPVRYRRKLPVVYGLFVLNGSVLILTVDSAKDDDAYVSFHVETDFMNRRQGVWNALTIAIVACLARDDLMKRLDDFDDADGPPKESDPDE